MANIDWTKIAAETEVVTKQKTDMVNTIRGACKSFMSDGKEYTINQVVHIVSNGLTIQARENNPEADEVKVNWSTARSALEGMTGVKAVAGKKNVYAMTKKSVNPVHK